MESIRDKFCASLRNWFEEEYAGDRTQLAADLGVSYEQICNILNGRRCGDEAWRRKTAAYVGIPYEKMIGLEETAVIGGNESEDAAPSRSADLLPGWLRQIVPQLRYLNRAQREKLAAWLELEGIGPPERGRVSPDGLMGGGRSGRVTSAKQIPEQARVQHLEAFRHQFPRLPDTRAGVAVHDGQAILAVNPAICQMLGAAEKDIIGTPVMDWLSPEERGAVCKRISMRDTNLHPIKLLNSAGDVLPMRVTMVRLANWRGRHVRVVSMRLAHGSGWGRGGKLRAAASDESDDPVSMEGVG